MKTIIMEVTAPLLFKKDKNGNMAIPGEYKQKFTKDDVGYLVKEEKINTE
jgi:hypothetical protein